MTSKRKRLTLKEKVDILEFRASNTNIGVHALAEKCSVKYISSIKIQNTSLLSNTVQLENALTCKITISQTNKQTKVTEFFLVCT